MVLPIIGPDHFTGGRNVTEGNAIPGQDLASLFINLQQGTSSLNDADSGAKTYPLQSVVVPLAGGAKDVDIPIPSGVSVRVLSARVLNKAAGNAGDTLQVKKKNDTTITDITDAIDISGADKTVAQSSTVDHGEYDLFGDQADELRLSLVGASSPDVDVILDLITL